MFPARPHGNRPRRIAPLIAFAALVALGACRAGPGGAGVAAEGVIAEIGGEPVTRAEFDAYVEGVMQGAGGEQPEAPSAELMSRLLDRFLDEELVVRDARRRGITVSEREVTDALRQIQAPEEARASVPPQDQGAARERMRRSLLVRKFREKVVLSGLTVSQEEIAAHYQAHRDDFHQAARIVLRQILLDDPVEAKTIRETLVRDPRRFQEIAEQRSLAPDGGRPRAYEETDLPQEIVAAISSVPEGGVSGVVTTAKASRIFLVEKRQPERLVGIDEASDRIRVVILQEKGRRAYEEFMSALRRESGLAIHEESLPFPYRRRTS